MITASRRKQIRKKGSKFCLYSADGSKILGEYASLAAAEAGARRIYGAHKGKRSSSSGKARGRKVSCKRARSVAKRCSSKKRPRAR